MGLGGSETLASDFTLPPSILLAEEPRGSRAEGGVMPVITKFMEVGWDPKVRRSVS